MNKISNDEDLLLRLKIEDNAAFSEMYKKYFNNAKIFIVQNNGNFSDAEDIFQEALFVLVKNLRSNDFEIKVSFPSYFQSIIKFSWFKKLRSKKEYSSDTLPEIVEDNITNENDMLTKDVHHNLLEKVMAENLKADCRELLNAFYYLKQNLAAIANTMNLSESFIKVKKHRCMEYLANAYTQHPDFKNIKNAQA